MKLVDVAGWLVAEQESDLGIHEQTLNKDHKTITDHRNQSKCSLAQIEAQQTNSDKNKN
jgi:hypothetical protein